MLSVLLSLALLWQAWLLSAAWVWRWRLLALLLALAVALLATAPGLARLDTQLFGARCRLGG